MTLDVPTTQTIFDLPIVHVVQCQFCRFWKPDDDGEAGECVSALMADMVWSKWDAGSPIMTAYNFECKYFEAAE